jgi:hypothetical protein
MLVGTRKMPLPIMMPITAPIAVNSDRPRGSTGGGGAVAGALTAGARYA